MSQNLEFKDGTFVGADEYMKKVKKQYPDDFEAEQKEVPLNKSTWVRGTSGTFKPATVSSEEAYRQQKYNKNKYYK